MAKNVSAQHLHTRLSAGMSNLYDSQTKFDDLLRAALLNHKHLWLAPLGYQLYAHALWMSVISWRIANEFTLAVAPSERPSAAPLTVQWAEYFCNTADEMTTKAVPMSTRPPESLNGSPVLVELPDIAIDPESALGVWRISEALAELVMSQLASVSGSMPNRFKPLIAKLISDAEGPLALIEHLRTNWQLEQAQPMSRARIAGQVMPHLKALYTIGQKLVAPSLLGSQYRQALDAKPSLQDLELGYDPWCLTSVKKRRELDSNPAAKSVAGQELAQYWSGIPNPSAVVALQDQLDDAHARKLLRRLGRYLPIRPWQETYMVYSPVVLGGRLWEVGTIIHLYAALDGAGNFEVAIKKGGMRRTPMELLGQK